MSGLEFKSTGVAVLDSGGATDEQGVIIGLASPFGGPPDGQGDVIEHGAYAESLKVRPWVPLLWQHLSGEPIGKTLLLAEAPEGLVFRAQILPTARGKDARVLVKGKVISGVSIGYDTVHSLPGNPKNGELRRLSQIDLFEISLVTWPAADRARVSEYASSPLVSALRDALVIAEVADLRRRRISVKGSLLLAEVEALHRQAQRLTYDGKTIRQMIYDINYELQELRKL